jgi:hypothetical protein
VTAKAAVRKKKGVVIRDLNKIALEDLGPDQIHIIKGGKAISFGTSGDECAALVVVVGFTHDLHEIYIGKCGGLIAAKISR